MKNKKTPILLIFLLLLIYLVVSMVIWFFPTPKVEKQGELVRYPPMPTAQGNFLERIKEQREGDGFTQYIYENPTDAKLRHLVFITKKNRDKFFLGVAFNSFYRCGENEDRIIFSLPYRDHVYEVDITCQQFESFAGKSFHQMDQMEIEKLIDSMVVTNKQKEFFDKFGRVY